MGEEEGNAGGVLLALKEDRCVGCTHCLRVCPTEAIRVRGGKAQRTPHRCIDCGECVRVCPWKAWAVEVDPWERALEKGGAVAVLDPAVFAQFGDRAFPPDILRAFGEIGFSRAKDLGEGLFLYRRAVRRYLSSGRATLPVISSDCPAVVHLVQVKFPSLLENLVPVASPFEIMARQLRKEFRGGGEQEMYSIVPCLAKARAATETRIPDGAYHRALPILDLYSSLQARLHRQAGKEVPEPGKRSSIPGLEWAIPGGQTRALGLGASLLVDGVKEVEEVLELAENGRLEKVPFIEAWTCRGGCLGGSLNVRNPFWARFELSSRIGANDAGDRDFPGAGEAGEDGEDYFLESPLSPRTGMRLDENLQVAMQKLRRIDEVIKKFPGIDCGSCGSPSCLALAEDVVQGYALETDCISVLKEVKTLEAATEKGASERRPPKSKKKRR